MPGTGGNLSGAMEDSLSPILFVVGADSKRLQWITHHVTSQWPEAVVSAVPASNARTLASHIANPAPDAVFLQMEFGIAGMADDTVDTMRQLLRLHPSLHCIVLAREGSELTAVRALRSGARNYLPLAGLTRENLLAAISEACAERAAAQAARKVLEAAQPVAPAFSLPGYEILREIATSNFSSVYLARSQKRSRNVVLKVMGTGKSSREQQDAERFVREYEIISSISHPAIVQIHDFGTLPRHLYLAMEYFPCGDLRDRLRNPLSVEESRYYLRAIAEALRVIHVFGIYHRDLKPANVMLREDNSPVLIDFGLARRAADDGSATGAGKVLGSPFYMSPEQAQAQPVDARTDIYSLGVMFHEMLTGSRPYLGRSAMAIMAQHTKSPVPVLPAGLADQQPILNRLMAKEPNARYSCTDELLADLTAETRAA